MSGSPDVIRTHGRPLVQEYRLWLKRPPPLVGERDKSLETRTIGRRIESSWRNVSGNGIGPKMEQDRSNWEGSAPRICPSHRAHSMPSSLRGCLCHPL